MDTSKDKTFDLAVIGTGMAGTAAAVFAANRGLATAQVGETGELIFASGYLDLLGVFPHPAQVKRLFVRDLTDKSKGNANGIGLADVTTKRLVDKIDYTATYKNCITGISLEKAAVPMYFENDREAIAVALGSIGLIPAAQSKIVRIKNTLRVDTAEVSEAYAEMFQQRSDLEVIGGPDAMVFNGENNLS